MRRLFSLLLVLFLGISTASGGGYQVGLHSMRSIGMGLIGTSLSYDASTQFFNPGGGAFVNEKWSFSGGVSFLMARTTFQAKDAMYQTHTEHKMNYPLYFYAAFKPLPNLSVGLAVNTPYGNGLSWGDDWKGRYLIQDISFRAFTFQPTISYKFKDIVGIGAGFVIAWGTADINKAVPLDGYSGEGSLNVKGSTTRFGYNVGIMVHPVKGLSLGLDYRSKIDMKLDEADVTFSNIPVSLSTRFPNTTASTSLPLPANLDFGASYDFGKFMIGINLCYVFWNTYDSLVFEFEKQTADQSLTRSASPTLYENRLIARIGAQYRINDLITVRIGGYYDPSPVKDDYLHPQTPSMNQIGLTCGLSVFPVKGLSIDAAFVYINGAKRAGTYSPENFAGSYANAVFNPGIGLTYNF